MAKFSINKDEIGNQSISDLMAIKKYAAKKMDGKQKENLVEEPPKDEYWSAVHAAVGKEIKARIELIAPRPSK